MQKHSNSHKHLSMTDIENPKTTNTIDQTDTWEEYSFIHDSLAELFSYENSRKSSSDFWQLNYV